MATAGLLEVQETCEVSFVRRPTPLVPITTKLTVGFGCPIWGMLIDCALGMMDKPEIEPVAGPDTVKTAVAVTTLPSGLPVAMAVMAVVPALTPVATPVDVMVATDGLLEYQATVYPVTGIS